MLPHPPDTFVVGGACGTLGCMSNSFSNPTSLLMIPYPFTFDQGVANMYLSTLLLSTVITWNIAVYGGTFYSCPTFLSSSMSVLFPSVWNFHQRCPLGIFSSSDLSIVPYSGESSCSYKIRWIINDNDRHGTVSANAIASIHCCLDCCLFYIARWALLPTWKAGSDKLIWHSTTAVAYSHGKWYKKLWSNFTLRYKFTPCGAHCTTMFSYMCTYCTSYNWHSHH